MSILDLGPVKDCNLGSLSIVGAVVIFLCFLLLIEWFLSVSGVNEVEKSFLKAFALNELSLIGMTVISQVGTVMAINFLTEREAPPYWLIFGYHLLAVYITPGFFQVWKAVQEAEDRDLLNYEKIKKVILPSFLVFTLWVLLLLTALFGNVQFLWNPSADYASSGGHVVFGLDQQGEWKLQKMEKGGGLLAVGLQKELGEEQFFYVMLGVWLVKVAVGVRAAVYYFSWVFEEWKKIVDWFMHNN